MAYFKGSISFGLVYVPVSLVNSVKENSIGFNMIDRQTMSRVKYKKTCVDCGDREVKQEDIVKGYEYEENKYVIFTDEDFEKIKSKRDKNINIESFVEESEIDPIYYEKTYYVVPTGAEKAFSLLIKAMTDMNKVAIAKTVLGAKEALIAIRVKDGKMILSTLYFKDEIVANPVIQENSQTDEKELDIAKTIIKSMSGKFEPGKYKDEYREKIKEAIERKIAGKEIIKTSDKSEESVVDLMDALQKSLMSISGSKNKTVTKKPKSSKKQGA